MNHFSLFTGIGGIDIAAFLPGWENSKGATIEHMVARALGKEIEYVRDK